MINTVTTSIGGSVFHVEEDAHATLKQYLDALQRYFGSYPDSHEILTDIEARIAELLAQRLGGVRQAVNTEDVAYIVQTVGTVEDFKSADAEPDGSSTNSFSSAGTAADPDTQYEYRYTYSAGNSYATTKRQLVCSTNNRVIAGVAGGLGAYLGIDATWIRLMVVFVVFGVWFFPAFGIWPILAYVVMAVALPKAETIYKGTDRRFYRDSERKKIEGVAAGLSNYLGISVGVVRILFVLLIFLGGSGILIYLVLFASSKYAITPAEKLAAQGKPVTISGIEESMKQTFSDARIRQGENLVGGLLNSFGTLLAGILKVIEPVLKALINVVRVFAGIVLFILGLAGLTTVAVAIGAMFYGLPASANWFRMDGPDGAPMGELLHEMPTWTAGLGVAAFAIPFVMIFLIGVAMMANRWFVRGPLAATLLGIWIVVVLAFSISVVPFARQFDREASITTIKTIGIPSDSLSTITLQARGTGEGRFREERYALEGYQGDSIQLVATASAKGSTDEDARLHAQAVSVNGPQWKGNVLEFPQVFGTKAGEPFRFAHVKTTIRVPYDRPFMLGDRMRYDVDVSWQGKGPWDYHEDGRRFVLTPDGMRCLNCTDYGTDDESQEDEWEESASSKKSHKVEDIYDDHGVRIRVEQDVENDKKIRTRIKTGDDSITVSVE